MIFRAKLNYENTGVYNYTTVINGEAITKRIVVLPKCHNAIIVKYLDNNGFYRFLQMSGRYNEKIATKKIGNLFDFQTNSFKSAGVDATRKITGTIIIEEQYLSVAKWLFVSPVIELKINDTWIRATLNDGEYVIRKAKGGNIIIDLTFEITEYKTITY